MCYEHITRAVAAVDMPAQLPRLIQFGIAVRQKIGLKAFSINFP